MDRPLVRCTVTARARRDDGWRTATLIVLALLAGLVVVLVARSWRGSSAVLRPDPEPVLDVSIGEIIGGAAIGDSIVVVGSGGTLGGDGRLSLVQLDADTGAERARVLLDGRSVMDGVAEVDGQLVLRLDGRLPGVPSILLPAAEAEEAARFDGEAWLVVVDGETLAPVRQYQLPSFRDSPSSERVVEPLVVVDGVYWMLGASSRRARIDLRTGATWFARDVFDRSISGVLLLDDRLVVVAWGIVRVIDLDTGDIVGRYQAEEFPAMMNARQPVDFRIHDNQVWAAPLIRDVEDLPLRLDLETGALIDERPSTPIPGLVVESGGSRWELTGRRVAANDGQVPVPEPEDRWRQVDPATNEVLAVFDLGSWQPVFATPDHLWVTRDGADRPGSLLARISLDLRTGS